ncbi:MAG: hypothetical protein ACKO3K_02650 [Cuspidothrix sp.]
MKKLSILTFSILSLACTLQAENVNAITAINNTNIDKTTANYLSLEQQAQKLYENGQFPAAISLLEQAIKNYTLQGDIIGQITAKRNLALIYQKTGKLPEGKQVIDNILKQIQPIATSPQRDKLFAEILEVQGQIQLSMGHSQEALDSWKLAANTYKKQANNIGLVRSQINQSQALQALGLYTQAVKTLTETQITLNNEKNTLLKAKGLKTLGDIQRGIGKLKESGQTLTRSLEVAEKISAAGAITEALLSLGKTARIENNIPKALEYYSKAIKKSPTPDLLIQAQLNQLEALIESKKIDEAKALILEIQKSFTTLPPSRTAVYARITLGKILLKLPKEHYSPSLIAPELAKAIQLAKKLEDKRAESYAMGILGNLHEKNKRYPEAKQLTEKALLISQGNNAPDLSYQWRWQLGRILKIQKQNKPAIAAYSQSVKTLKSLRTDLVAISSEVQFSFRESVEPVYRELVDLLLQPGASQENLKEAREVLESLQLAELDNFFRNACLDAKPVEIDQLDSTSAIFYSIILQDRLEVIVALPGKRFYQNTTYLSKAEIDSDLKLMRATLASPRERIFNQKRLNLSKKIYNWLIAPIDSELQKNQIKNLVFIS